MSQGRSKRSKVVPQSKLKSKGESFACALLSRLSGFQQEEQVLQEG